MAGKKPAKPMAGRGASLGQDPAIYGSPVKYVGMKGSFVECATCGKQTSRGMVRLKGEHTFCSAGCASKFSN